MNYYNFLKPLLFKLQPETAHNLAINTIKCRLIPAPRPASYPSLNTKVLGINFSNPIGMAAGFDKNALIFSELANFGFGFVECGTVTPKAQAGNDKPRLFRLEEDGAIINRLGFNNQGIDNFLDNVKSATIKEAILGINIGKNKDTVSAIDDYIFLLDKVYGRSDYITINISSPNTKNLRDLQKADELDIFLAAIKTKKNQLIVSRNKNIPLLLKIAPDLTIEEQESIAALALKHQIDGLIISNTTISRAGDLQSANQNQVGGLSGKPLFTMSNLVLKNLYQLTKGSIPLIGVGGISCASDAYQKIKYGASLVQIYSAFIYQGFGLVEKIKQELDEMVRKDGFSNIGEAVGKDNC